MSRNTTTPQVRARKSNGLQTPLLQFLAGEHSAAIETLWPAPHEGFFALPTPRRHAVAMLLAGIGGKSKLSSDRLAQFVERQKDRAVADLLMGPAHSQGLMKMLAKCGETLWTTQDYADLLALFRAESSNQVLRHMQEVTPRALMPLLLLPPQLRSARIVSYMPHLSAAYDLSAAWNIIGRISGEAGQKRATDRWNKVASRQSLFALASGDLLPKAPVAFTPPPALPAVFRPVRSAKELRQTALEFTNCLEDYNWAVLKGRMAVYVWNGTPKAAVALNWNIDGWRLAEAEAAKNTELEDGPLREIVASLEPLGVRIGSSVEAVYNRLHRISQLNDIVVYPEEMNVKSFRDRCDLGDLWN